MTQVTEVFVKTPRQQILAALLTMVNETHPHRGHRKAKLCDLLEYSNPAI